MTEPEHHRNGATSDAKVLLVREVRMFTAAVGAPVVILLLLMWGCYQVIKPNADKMTDSHSGLIESVSESLKASSDAQLESSKAVRELQIQDAQKLHHPHCFAVDNLGLVAFRGGRVDLGARFAIRDEQVERDPRVERALAVFAGDLDVSDRVAADPPLALLAPFLPAEEIPDKEMLPA